MQKFSHRDILYLICIMWAHKILFTELRKGQKSAAGEEQLIPLEDSKDPPHEPYTTTTRYPQVLLPDTENVRNYTQPASLRCYQNGP